NISNETIIWHWVKVYKDTGEEGLMNIKPGRSKDMTKLSRTAQKWLFLGCISIFSYICYHLTCYCPSNAGDSGGQSNR
ncbi:TPA: hypothetical protein ACIYOK_005503, partial [Escherichia coli]